MIKNLSQIEVKVNDRLYRLLCEVDSPLGEVYDVLILMRAMIVAKMSEADNKKMESGDE